MLMTKEKRDTIVSALYERCSNGEISIDQREKLIQKTNSMFIVNETETHNVKESAQVELSPKEKYNMFKESVYKKYADGEINAEAREMLLEKARDRFFPEETNTSDE